MMQTLFLLFIILSISINSFAQVLSTEWVRSIPGSKTEQNNNSKQAPCGDIYMVGSFIEDFHTLTNMGIEDGYIAKYNEQGQLLWVKQIPRSEVNSISIVNDHEIYIVGAFRNTFRYNNDSLVSFNEVDVFVAKIDSSGTFQWANSASGWGYDGANDITVLPNGNIVLVGYYQNDLNFGPFSLLSSGREEVFLATIDSQGTPLWLESLNGPGSVKVYSVVTDNSNNIYITGSFLDFLYLDSSVITGSNADIYLAKYSSTGQLSWLKTMGGIDVDEGVHVNIDGQQNIVLVGWHDGSIHVDNLFLNGNNEEDGFIFKFTSTGDLVWAKSLAGDFDERIYKVAFDPNDNIYVMGTLDSLLVLNRDSLTNRHLNRPTDIFIAKYDTDGYYKWGQTLGHYYNDYGTGFIVKDPSTIYVSGVFQDTSIFINDTLISQFDFDVFIGKFNIDTTVSIRQIAAKNLPDLEQVKLYPNPAVDNKSTLEYTLNQQSNIHISIYDLLGQKHYEETIQNQPFGNYQNQIMLPNNLTTVYFVCIETEQSIQIRKLVLE